MEQLKLKDHMSNVQEKMLDMEDNGMSRYMS